MVVAKVTGLPAGWPASSVPRSQSGDGLATPGFWNCLGAVICRVGNGWRFSLFFVNAFELSGGFGESHIRSVLSSSPLLLSLQKSCTATS